MNQKWKHHYHRKIQLFEKLYQFTKDQCGFCVESGCACKDNICKHVQEQALKRGVQLKPTGHALRFIGPGGCIVAPHLRETCTIYLCESAQKKPHFDDRQYRKIKRVCERVELKLMELEDGSV